MRTTLFFATRIAYSYEQDRVQKMFSNIRNMPCWTEIWCMFAMLFTSRTALFFVQARRETIGYTTARIQDLNLTDIFRFRFAVWKRMMSVTFHDTRCVFHQENVYQNNDSVFYQQDIFYETDHFLYETDIFCVRVNIIPRHGGKWWIYDEEEGDTNMPS